MTSTTRHFPTPAQLLQWQYIHAHITPIDWNKVADVEMRVPALIEYGARHFHEFELLVFDDQRLSYGDAAQQSALLARQLLAAGIGKGHRIGMLFPNSPQFIVTWLAIVRIGAVAVPVSTLSTAAEMRRTLIHADVQLLIACDGYLKHDYIARLGEALACTDAQLPLLLPEIPYLRGVWFWSEKSLPQWAQRIDLHAATTISGDMLRAIEAQVTPSDPISIIYTSGSMSEPKGIIHSHGNFMRSAARCAACYGYEQDDRTFISSPLFWVGGLVVQLLQSMYIGMTVLSSAHTGSKLLDFLERERATYLFVWPYLARAIADDPTFAGRDFSFVRGGGVIEAIPPQRRAKNQPFFANALGMTESTGPHSVPLKDVPDDMIGTMGPLVPGMEHRIVNMETGTVCAEHERGDLFVRGDAMLLGMVKRERSEIFDSDGWYRTGDLCSYRSGQLFFHGRTDDMIKTAGANVSPQEVETALKKQPGVAQAYVYAVPDRKRGVTVGAILVPNPEGNINVEAILRGAGTELSSYKVPKVALAIAAAELPMTNTGKMDRRKLIALLTEAYEKKTTT